MHAKDEKEDLKINLETEFSNVDAGQCTLAKKGRINIGGSLRSSVKVLEAFIGQGSESWSWYLSFEDL